MLRDSKILLCLCLFVLGFALVGCDEAEETQTTVAEEVAFDVVGRGRNSQLQDTTEIRISDAETWQAYADSLSPLGSLQEVDFDERDVVLMALPATSAGYDLSVSTVDRVDDRLRVRYLVEEPGEDCLTAQVMLTPFIAVAIEKTEGEPEFDRQRERYSCGVRQR